PVPGADDAPGEPLGRPGLVSQPPTQLGHMAIGLDVVATATGGDNVLPGVRAAAAARDDVVDAGRHGTAVHTPTAVPGEERTAGERNGAAKGHPHEPLEADDAGGGYDTGCAVHEGAGVLKADGLVVEDED